MKRSWDPQQGKQGLRSQSGVCQEPGSHPAPSSGPLPLHHTPCDDRWPASDDSPLVASHKAPPMCLWRCWRSALETPRGHSLDASRRRSSLLQDACFLLGEAQPLGPAMLPLHGPSLVLWLLGPCIQPQSLAIPTPSCPLHAPSLYQNIPF